MRFEILMAIIIKFFVEVLGFGAVCICRSMPTFRRYMLSPSLGAEVTRQGSRGLI
jgi:hypothetical protein